MTDSCQNYNVYTVKKKNAEKGKITALFQRIKQSNNDISSELKNASNETKSSLLKRKVQHSCDHHYGRKLN